MQRFTGLLSANLVLLIAISVTGCALQTQSQATTSYSVYEPIVDEWVRDYSDDICEELGKRVSFGLPGIKDVAGQIIKDSLASDLKWQILKVEKNGSTGEDILTVAISRNFVLNIDVKLATISENYTMKLDYILNIKDDTIKDSDIDLESFSTTKN